MASANENCCINELIFKKRSMLIECVIAHHTSTHQSAETTTGIAAMLRGTQVAFLTLLKGLHIRVGPDPFRTKDLF